jgi:hypothetical protein
MTRVWCVVSALMLVACASELDIEGATENGIELPDLDNSAPSPIPGPCLTAEPDSVINIPTALPSAGVAVRSGTGSYAYDDNDCSSFIVDIHQEIDSNAAQDRYGNWLPEGVIIAGRAFDLPSSAAYGGRVPTTRYDCERLDIRIVGYSRAGAEPFDTTPVLSATTRGTWYSDGICRLHTTEDIGSTTRDYCPRSDAVITHRWLVRVRERGTAQQAEVVVEDGPDDTWCSVR